MLRIRFAGIIALAGLTGCLAKTTGSDPSMLGLNNTLSSHTLKAAYINYPPSLTVNPNSRAISGIMPEVINEAAKAMGVQVSYVEETSFGSMIDELNNQHADIVVSGIWPSSARALKADFSRVVYYSPVYAYVGSSDTRFDGNLATANNGKIRIATIDGELSSIVAASDYPASQAVSLPQQTDVSQLLLQLTSGKADLTFVEPAIADAFLAKNPKSIKRVGGAGPVRLFPNTFLFRKGDTGLRDAINIAIVELTNSRRVSAIVKPFDPDGAHFIIPSPPVSP